MQNSQDPKKRNTKCPRNAIESNTLSFNQKTRMYFASNDLMSYEKQAKKILSALNLRSTSTGISNKKLIFSGLALLLFCGFGHLVTGSNAHAVNVNQATLLADRLLESSEYDPNEESKVSSLGNRALNTQAKSAGTTSVDEKLTPDQQQPTTLETEGNPAKELRLNQTPTDSTEVVANPDGQTVPDQLQPTTTEGTETRTVSQSTNPIDGVGEARDVGTDDFEVQPGISVDQVLAATPGITDTTQTVEAVAEPSDGIYSVSLQKLINEQKLYCIEALNPCYPFIYNTTNTIDNLRFFNGYTESITMNQANPDDPIMRKYTSDKGKGSVNVMNFLFPSPSGDLNVAAGSEKVDNLDKLNPTPERLARILPVLYNYRVCRKNGIRAERLNPKTDRVCEKLGLTDDEKKAKETANLHHKYCPKDMYLNFIQDAEYMIENQEKNGFSKDEEVRIFPKYTTERLIISYFLKKFDKDEDIKKFYDEITKQLKDETTPMLNRKIKIVTEKDLNDAKNNLEETIKMLKKCNIAASDYSPYKEATKENSTCPAIKDISYGKISFGGIFSDCADIAARHVFNLLLHSQGKIDHPDAPWANILPAEGSDEEKSLEEKLEEVRGAITDARKGEGKKVNFYPLKDRLQMFFLHQKKVGADAGDEVTRTLWEYAICNLTEPDGEIGRVNYVRGKIYELETGYKNMLTLMCRCAKVLFPEKDKDIKVAYAKVKKCSEYEPNENLTSAIIDVFKLFNQFNPKIEILKNKVSISYPDLGNLEFHIKQLDYHGKVDYKPAANKTILTEEEISAIRKSENDFTKMLAEFTSNRSFVLQDDFHNLFFGKGLYYDNDFKKFNLTLFSDKITDSDFLSRCQALRFLKYSQGEEHNRERIESLLKMYVRPHIDSSLIMWLPSGETTNFRDFVVDKYREPLFNVCDYLKSIELINRNNEVTITSFGDSAGWAKNNTDTKFRYTLDENGNAILYPMEDKENLYIPSTITTKKGTFNVSGIGCRACYSSEFLKRVVIEVGATDFQIEQGAFGWCGNLESITIHSTGELRTLNIGNGAFSFSGIESFIVPDSVTELVIGRYAFRNPSLRSFIFPKNVKNLTIGDCAFFSSHIECLDLSSYTGLESIVIGDSAFVGSCIKSIILPKNVETLKIGMYAFKGCPIECLDLSLCINLESIVIDSSAFEGCEYFTGLDLSSCTVLNEVLIGRSAFKDCRSFVVLKFSPNLRSLVINDNAFSCLNLKEFIVPNSVNCLKIWEDVFANCTELKIFTIPESVTVLTLVWSSFSSYCTVRVPEKLKKELGLWRHLYKIEYYKSESES